MRRHRRGPGDRHPRAKLATGALRWDGRQLEPLLANGFRDALRAFPVRARRFDASLRPADIYQAARNALTMHCLQSLLGVPVESTPAVVGYSLLYPYTDNLLDDESLGAAAKMAFSRRLAERLRGREVEPDDRREARIFELVGMIETQFDRARFPDVFASLLAIHRAQERSVALLGGAAPLPARTIVEIGVEKGGTSVLADGYLVAGALTPAQAECIFGPGVFLQLRDDLDELERRSPFRFACLAAQRRRLSRAKGSLTGLLESWIAEEAELPPAVERRRALAAG